MGLETSESSINCRSHHTLHLVQSSKILFNSGGKYELNNFTVEVSGYLKTQ